MNSSIKSRSPRLAQNQRVLVWGTGAGVRLSKALMAQSGFGVGQEVELVTVPEGILLRPARPVYNIEDLAARMNDENRPEFIDFGPAVGNELL